MADISKFDMFGWPLFTDLSPARFARRKKTKTHVKPVDFVKEEKIELY